MEQELMERYGLVIEQGKRFYIEDLTQRDYTLENSVPHRFEIGDKVIETNKWGSLIEQLSLFLFTKYPDKTRGVLNYKTPWSKQQIFTVDPLSNFKHLVGGIYVNVNQTALHSCWLVQDLLDLFEIDRSSVTLLIRRSHDSEPREIAELVRNERISAFKEYLATVEGKKASECYMIVKFIRTEIEPRLRSDERSSTYTDIFRFDDQLTFYNYSKRINDSYKKDLLIPAEKKSKVDKYIGYLNSFYKSIRVN